MDTDVPAWTEDALLNHGQFVRRLARTLVRDEHEAEELAQETWLVALRKTPEAREGLRPWLARVVRGLAFTRRRAELRRVAREQHRSGESRVAPAADRALEDLELQQRVVAAVLTLAEPYRTAILLRYHHGLPASEIARETSSPLATVRTRLRRAQEMLRVRFDGEYGSRRSWCLALAGLGELSEWSPVGIGSSALTLLGGTIMSWKGAVAALAVVVAGIALWGLREGAEPGLEPEPRAAVLPGAALPAGEENASLEERVLGESESAEGTQREAVATNTAVPPPPGIWLVGKLVGSREAEGEKVQVSIGTLEVQPGVPLWSIPDAESRLILLRTELGIAEPFEVDLSPVFDRGKHVSELSVGVRHEAHLPLDHRLVIDPRVIEVAEAGGRAEVEALLELRPVVGRVTGTVTVPYGTEPRRLCAALVGFDGDGRPNRRPIDTALCDEAGRFELRTATSGRQVLVAWEEHRTLPPLRPVTRILEIESGDPLRLPPLNLTRGEAIEGEVVAVPGETRVHSVKAILADAGRLSYEFGTPEWRPMEWVGDEFELRQVALRTDEQGRFSLPALGPHLYAVSSEPFGRAPGGDDSPRVCRLSARDAHDPSTGARVRAPATDLQLGSDVAYAAFQVFADGRAPVGGVCKVAELLPQRAAFWHSDLDDQGRIIFSLRPDDVDGWVAFSAPGWTSRRAVHLNENALGHDTWQPIHLEPIEDPVDLSIRLELWSEGELGWATVTLQSWPAGESRPDLQERPPGAWLLDRRDPLLPSADGAFRLSAVTPGRYWCTLRPQRAEELGALPWRETSFELVVPSGQDCEVTHRQGSGGHLRVLTSDAAGLGSVYLVLHDPETDRDCAMLRAVGEGAYQTKSGLDPGDYLLRVMSGGEYRVLREVAVTLTAGEVTEVRLEP